MRFWHRAILAFTGNFRDLIDISAEIARLEAKRTQTTTQHDTLKKKTEQPNYAKVPEDIKTTNSQKVQCSYP